MRIVEATATDWAAVQQLFLEAPLDAGTSFVLDRSPDFGALLRRKGEARTFLAMVGDRLAGSASALWHDACDGNRRMRIGEICDLRVAAFARGGPAARRLLGAVREALRAAGVEWVVCLIGDANQAAIPLVTGRAGFQKLEPLTRYASVHYVAWKAGSIRRQGGVRVTRATGADRAEVVELLSAGMRLARFIPPRDAVWPLDEDHFGWVARDPQGRILGALLLWDGEAVRRIRISRYRRLDQPLRSATRLASWLGFCAPLPNPGGTLRLWSSRGLVVAVTDGQMTSTQVCHRLVHAALFTAAAAGRHVLQINLAGNDPLLSTLPRYPRSTYWSTLYGAPLDGTCTPGDLGRSYHVDVALV